MESQSFREHYGFSEAYGAVTFEKEATQRALSKVLGSSVQEGVLKGCSSSRQPQ